jgi:hypothetical protein
MSVARDNRIVETAVTTVTIMMAIMIVSLNLSFMKKPP